jgi:hypothetical protein
MISASAFLSVDENEFVVSPVDDTIDGAAGNT